MRHCLCEHLRLLRVSSDNARVVRGRPHWDLSGQLSNLPYGLQNLLALPRFLLKSRLSGARKMSRKLQAEALTCFAVPPSGLSRTKFEPW